MSNPESQSICVDCPGIKDIRNAQLAVEAARDGEQISDRTAEARQRVLCTRVFNLIIVAEERGCQRYHESTLQEQEMPSEALPALTSVCPNVDTAQRIGVLAFANTDFAGEGDLLKAEQASLNPSQESPITGRGFYL